MRHSAGLTGLGLNATPEPSPAPHEHVVDAFSQNFNVNGVNDDYLYNV
jgi:hypothetical protein